MVLPKRKDIAVDDVSLTDETGNDDKQSLQAKVEKDDDCSADVNLLPHKRHKKHKHKKHKKKRGSEQDAEDESESPTASEGGKPPLKLKIKFGGQTFGEKSVTKVEIPEASSEDSLGIVVDEGIASTTMNATTSDVDDEDAWLEALESGRLDTVDDELKVIKNPAQMTARQRALQESKNNKDKEEVALPPDAPQEKEVVSEEVMQRRILRAKKRKEQAEEKREKDKKQTIERLLKKNDVKTKGSKIRQAKKSNCPKMSYINNKDTILLLLPPGEEYPLSPQVSKIPPKPTLCGIEGCQKLKKYSCSKTGVPLCSLECYKKNMQQKFSNRGS